MRADAFESDRRQFYAKLEAIRLKQDLVHNTEWELKKRRQEKAELESALERCQGFLYVEREKILEMKRETDRLRVKQRGNKKQITDMLAASNSVEQHVYYNEAQNPEKIQSYANPTIGWSAEQESLQELYKGKQVDTKNGAVPRISIANTTAGASNPNILRTVYLPNEKVGQIRSESDRLESTIQSQRAEFERVIMHLRDEKAAFEEDKRTQYLMNKREIDDLTQQIHELEVFNQQVVRDHVDALSTHELNERRQQEELEQLRLENAAMREQIR